MIRIGIIGLGHLGKIHLSLLKSLPDFKIIGFYDTDSSLKIESGIENFKSAHELIEKCDAISIVTPTPFHFEYACKAIKAGKHVFIEKPVTLNSAEAKKLALLASEAGVIAQAGHVERFNPAFLAAESFISRPLFIDCERFATYNVRGTDVSVVLDLMIHDIDLVLHLVKSNIKKINATGSSVLCETYDIAEARIEFDNGCVANLRVNRVASESARKMHVFQKENYLTLDFLNKTLVKGIVQNKNIIHENLEVKLVNAIAHELQLFADAIKNKKTAAITLDEAYHTMKVVDEIMALIQK